MQYLISFLEGIITFLSPCLLPLLPIYLSYFAGGGLRSTRRTLLGAAGFVMGFTVMFVAMGALAGILGGFLVRYRNALNLVCGGIVVAFGLNYMGILRLNLFRGVGRMQSVGEPGLFSAFVFGLVFSVGWTPCVGAFLGSALMLASQRGHVLEGMGMLLSYSLGLGIPFVVSAVLIEKMKGAFGWVKSHYAILNRVCGGLLVLLGIAMATGTLGRLLTALG